MSTALRLTLSLALWVLEPLVDGANVTEGIVAVAVVVVAVKAVNGCVVKREEANEDLSKKTEGEMRVKLEDAEESCCVMISIGAAKRNPYILKSKP